MLQRDQERFRAIASYVHGTHLLLAAATVAIPVLAVAWPAGSGGLVPEWTDAAVVLLSAFVAGGSSLVVAADFAPTHRMVAWLRGGRRLTLLTAGVLIAALGVLLLMPSGQSTVSASAVPLAWALRAAARGSFWEGSARLFAGATICGIVAAALAVVDGGGWDPLTVVVAALLAFGVLGQDSIYTLALELDDLRSLDAERAVETERQRFSGDLHDIQGQHLGLLAVEAEIVARLIDAGDSPGALKHARRIQSITEDALDELHRVIHDTRPVTFAQELANAARVLEAAGVGVTRSSLPELGLPEEYDRLLGLTVREAITNILKHSDARHSKIEINELYRDGVPGVALTVVDSGPAVNNLRGPGSGLSTLRARYAEAGGTLTFTSDGEACLRAWLPAYGSGPR